jgi:hypothetical protein
LWLSGRRRRQKRSSRETGARRKEAAWLYHPDS